MLAGACVTLVAAQQPAPQPAQQPTFRSTTRLVVQTIYREGQGRANPIEGLTAKDFVVTEDGQPQEIAFVEFQRLAGTTGSLPALDAAPTPAAPPAAPLAAANRVAVATQTGIAASRPATSATEDRRLLVLYFDSSAMPPPDQCAPTPTRSSSSTSRCSRPT